MKVVSTVQADVMVTLEVPGTTLAKLTAILGKHSVSSHRKQGISDGLAQQSSSLYSDLQDACKAAGVDMWPYFHGEKV